MLASDATTARLIDKEGAIVMAVVSGNPRVAQQSKAMARRCVDEHVNKTFLQST